MDETTRLRRRADGRIVAGVCGGLAAHLRVNPVVVRLAFVLLAAANGIGVAAYVALWLWVPAEGRPADAPAPSRDYAQLVAYAAVALGLGTMVWLAADLPGVAVLPVVAGGAGAAILWQQADPGRRERWIAGTVRVREAWLRNLVGTVLVAVGIIGFLMSRGQLSQARQGLAATAVIVLGLGVILAPWLIRLLRELDEERRVRVRSQERAELAAHLHDSVLHTLTLIQRSAHDPREVQRLARAQERELRAWLYQPRANAGATLAAAVERVAAEVEEAHGVPIDVVCVGDCALDGRLGAALQAAREAMVNAAKYAEAPGISVFAEAEPEQVTIFVRDRGKGFDLDAVPQDRLGVRESIIGRMRRNGGTAVIRTAPGEGTEVKLQVKRDG